MAAIDPNLLFARAHQAFSAGRLEEAETLLDTVTHAIGRNAAILHLRALTAKRMGDRDTARQRFEEALRLDPRDSEILSNYGNLLADLGQLEAALDSYGKALDSRPAFVDARLNRAAALQKLERHEDALADLDAALTSGSARAHSMRGSSLLSLGRLDEAAEAFDAALELDGGRATALAGRATVALRRGEDEAVALFERAAAARPGDSTILMKLAEAMEFVGDPRALSTLEAVVQAQPAWIEGQMILARMRWEAGEGPEFTRGLTEALSRSPDDEPLWTALAGVLGAAEMRLEAADAAARGQQAVGGSPALALLEAIQASETGDVDRADAAFARVTQDLPGGRTAEARHRLRTRETQRAQALLTDELDARPWDITAWALQGVVWRLTGDDRYQWLHGQPGLVSQQRLDLSAEQIASIADLLRSLHHTRTHPIGQSLRGGTQTRGRLFDRTESEIRLLQRAIVEAVDRHWNALPKRDHRHPLLRLRDFRPRIEGSWSVRLTDGGFHVAHVHPEGALSSASYLVVPGSTGAGEGWLEIDCPPAELGLDLGPLLSFEPQPGTLVLFPSTMFHGTRRFGSGERLTVAFDVLAG
jgi:tetratricopeptide (TPR) repeat protein